MCSLYKRILTLLALLSVLLFNPSWAAGFFGSSMAGSRIGQDWHGQGLNGQMVQAQDTLGKLHLYYFGFTQCPDVCPSALANLSLVREELNAEEREQIQMVFVTVDPERDTPEVIQAYLQSFEGDFIGLTGSEEQIAKMARQFRVKYRKVPTASSKNGDNSQSYTMEHSSQFFLFDRKAQPRLFYHSDADPNKIAQDIRLILSEKE